ncbi:GTPase-associated system all-helical protein GASH [Bradyrhizobium stylosanthis]|uniref:GTPase-associated system helical domain-containing protein n=1 Tax=Bradyrhizobium stylosanthis TaxID=1803665 RepID=A0A560D680_9BRAD|nr:GTPase-associated system all-helical protein GASH [Bradyrhizobium stylosanthis]TWA92610.1 hypothetical protein FBZ96_11080 [Bradyrhizobium stylosanthis]
MTKLNFADRYAQAGLSPGGAIIASRQAPAERILKEIAVPRIFDLVQLYFGRSDLDLTWLRDEFIQEDAAFSLINNQRECVVLATTMLEAKVAEGNSYTLLALLTASLAGKRCSLEFGWLLDAAKDKFSEQAVAARRPDKIDPKVKVAKSHPKLSEELVASPVNDWPTLLANIGKVRAEASEASATIATQASSILGAVDKQMRYLREETQILWWVFGEHSRTFNRPFSSYSPGAAAVIAGVDLGNLTTASVLGPIAAPAILERVLRLTNMKADHQKCRLADALDGIEPSELQGLQLRKDQPSNIFPITMAIGKAKENPGSWYSTFEKLTGMNATIEFAPIELATQIYYEHLLGQLQ